MAEGVSLVPEDSPAEASETKQQTETRLEEHRRECPRAVDQGVTRASWDQQEERERERETRNMRNSN